MQSFAKGLLDVADNMGRASSVVKDSFAKMDTSEDSTGAVALLKTLLEGVEMTEKQLAEVSLFLFCPSRCQKLSSLIELPWAVSVSCHVLLFFFFFNIVNDIFWTFLYHIYAESLIFRISSVAIY